MEVIQWTQTGGFVYLFDMFANSQEFSKNMVGWFHLTLHRTKEVSGRTMTSKPTTSNCRQPDYQSLIKVKNNATGEHTYQNKVF